MFKHYIQYLLAFFALSILLNGCRSDADKMAQFCLEMHDAIDSAQSCKEMAANLDKVLDRTQAVLKDGSLCKNSTACLPCKEASRKMLHMCGYDEDFIPVLRKLHFSTELRKNRDEQE